MKKHLTDGELRAALDGEVDVEQLQHLESCRDCQTRQSQLQAEQKQIARQLAFLTPLMGQSLRLKRYGIVSLNR